MSSTKSAQGRTLDEILLRVREGAAEDQAEAKADRRKARSQRLEANARRYEMRLESTSKERDAIDSEHRVETDSSLIGWGIGTGGGGMILLAGPVAVIGGLVPAHKWRGIGEAAKTGFSEADRKASLDSNHHGDLTGLEVDAGDAIAKAAQDRIARARFARELSVSFESELRAAQSQAIAGDHEGAAANGTAAYRANLQNARASLEAIGEAADERRALREASLAAKKERLQRAHEAQRLRLHGGATRALAQGGTMVIGEIGLALSWCTYGISSGVAQIASGAINVSVEESLKSSDRRAAQASKESERLHRTELLIEDRAADADERVEAEQQRLEEIAAQQENILRKMQA